MNLNGITPFQIVIIAIFGVGALVGLFVFANFSGGGSTKDEIGAVVIWGTLPRDAMKGALDELSSADERYAKVVYEEKTAGSFSRELSDALASGAGPDAVIITQEMLRAEQGKLRLIPFSSLPERTYVDTYASIFELFLTEEGTYGVPLALDPLVLYVNRSLLSSANIPSAPSTWEAVAGMAPTLTRRNDQGAIGRSAIALGEYGNIRNARAIISLLLLQAGTPITVSDASGTSAVFADDDPGSFGLTPAASAVNFYAQFADPAKTVYSWNRSLPDSRAGFVSGDIALYLGFASELPYLTSANPNLDFDMASAPMPGTLQSRVNYGLGYALAIPKGAPNPAGALQTAFMLGGQLYGDQVARGASMAPASRSSLGAQVADRYQSVFYPEGLTAKGWLSPSPAITDNAFSVMIADITTGRKSVEQALNSASQAIDAGFR